MSSRAASGRRRLQAGNTSPSKSKSKPLKATNAASTGGHFEKSFLAALRPLVRGDTDINVDRRQFTTCCADSARQVPPKRPYPRRRPPRRPRRRTRLAWRRNRYAQKARIESPPPPLVFSDQPRSPLGLVSPALSSGSNNTVLSPLRKGDNVYLPTPPPPPLESRSGSSDSGSVTSVASSHSSMNVNAPTSYLSHSSGSTDSQSTPSPSAFVFPSSRSRHTRLRHPQSSSSSPKRTKGNKWKLRSIRLRRARLIASRLNHPPQTSVLPALRPILYLFTRTILRKSGPVLSSPHPDLEHTPNSPPPKLKLPLKKKSKSSAGSDRQSDPHRRFMGIPLNRKKKPSQDQSADIGSDLSDPSSPRSSSVDTASFIGSTSFSIEPQWTPPSSPSKRDSYPLDPYDSILLEQCVPRVHSSFLLLTLHSRRDRLGTELLKRLNSVDGPSFHHYGNNPPATVLDLGCGEGHWMLDAAVAWKGYGTKVTGFDMVDITKSLRTAALGTESLRTSRS